MKLSRTLGPLVLGLAAVSGVSALEWSLDSVSTAQPENVPSPPSVVTQEFLGSFKVPFDLKGGGVEAKAHAMLGAYPLEGYADFDVLALTLAFQQPGSDFHTLQTTLGRFTMTDPTGLILSHPGDGAQITIDFDGMDLTVAAGYTGFVNRASSGISMTLEDSAHSSDLFASKRLLGSVEASVPLFGVQRFTLGALVQHDMNPSSDLISSGTTTQSFVEGGTLDTQYLTVKLTGPVVGRLVYGVSGALETGTTLSWVSGAYQYEPILSGLAEADLSYYFPGSLDAAVKARVIGATGDTSATSTVEGNVSTLETLFIPITPSTLGVVFSPGLSNLVYYELGGSLKPLPGLDMVSGVKVMGFQRALSGVVDASGFSGSGPLWMGTEVDLTTSWAIVSDCAFTVAGGGFFPNGSSFQWAMTAGLDLGL